MKVLERKFVDTAYGVNITAIIAYFNLVTLISVEIYEINIVVLHYIKHICFFNIH